MNYGELLKQLRVECNKGNCTDAQKELLEQAIEAIQTLYQERSKYKMEVADLKWRLDRCYEI